MQALIPLAVYLAVASGARPTPVPHAYLADPLPVYHQSRDTRTGEHAYSYAGGPSAAEEVKGLDGVTRGSYSYVDARGLLQSVFYVADEGGFRVAATNLPTDDDLPSEPAEVRLAKSALFAEQARAIAGRERRSVREEPDTSGRGANKVLSTEKDARREFDDQNPAESVNIYGAVSLPILATAVSRQSRLDVHGSLRVEPVDAQDVVEIQGNPVYDSSIASDRSEVHAAGPESEVNVHHASPSYHQDRVQLHRDFGIEGAHPRDAVKIDARPVAVLDAAPLAKILPEVSTVSVISADATVSAISPVPTTSAVQSVPTLNSLVTAYSSQSRRQIHRNSALELTAPLIATLPYYDSAVYQPIPVARSSSHRSQIHSSRKLEAAGGQIYVASPAAVVAEPADQSGSP